MNKKKVKKPTVKELKNKIKKLEQQHYLNCARLSVTEKDNLHLNKSLNEKTNVINRFIENDKQFRSIVELSEYSKNNHNVCLERLNGDYTKFWQEVNELRRYLIEIYRILNKYDLYRVKEEANS